MSFKYFVARVLPYMLCIAIAFFSLGCISFADEVGVTALSADDLSDVELGCFALGLGGALWAFCCVFLAPLLGKTLLSVFKRNRRH